MTRPDRQQSWLLLIYSLPSQPTKKRAYVWRELKRLGAIYLRDGVALLPRVDVLEGRLAELVQRIEEYEGNADLIVAPTFRPERGREFQRRFDEERTAEYRELHRAGTRFLRDVLAEVDANDFSFPDVDALESELHRLGRWQEQIAERDYFGAEGAEQVAEILEKCDRAFENFAAQASEREDRTAERSGEDVYQQLGGTAGAAPLPDDYPL